MTPNQLEARKKLIKQHLEDPGLTTTYEKQAEKKKNGVYIDTRSRVD